MIRWVKGAKPGKASVKWKCEPQEAQERKTRGSPVHNNNIS